MNLQDFKNQNDSIKDTEKGFLQYLSFRYYKQTFDHFSDMTKDSVNNFLKSISEIENEFRFILSNEQNIDLHDFGFIIPGKGFTEENY